MGAPWRDLPPRFGKVYMGSSIGGHLAIDTSVCSVDILNGEYDWSGTPTAGAELAAAIPGARYKTMPGLGHFPMCENPSRFLAEIRPVLERIVG